MDLALIFKFKSTHIGYQYQVFKTNNIHKKVPIIDKIVLLLLHIITIKRATLYSEKKNILKRNELNTLL